MKNMELDYKVKRYIVSCIDGSGYEVDTDRMDEKGKLQFLYNTFKTEYGWNIQRVGEYKAVTEWLQGLPTCFGIDFENYHILHLAYNWGSIKETDTESRKDKILSNWFNFIMVKTYQLFKKYKINA